MTQSNSNINEITKLDLCNGCGTCYSICQKNAISLNLNRSGTCITAHIDKNDCIKCGECVRYCPSFISLFNQSEESIVGKYLELYYGYSLDDDLRFRASSGGIVTQVLLYLQESKLIDGIIIPIPSKGSPFLYEPHIINNKQEIIDNSGTRYFPIPTNKIVRELLKKQGRYVFIGTPCILEGLIELEKKYPKLKDMIFLKIGFFCGGTPNLNAYKYLMHKKNIPCEGLKSIFRGKGWPGNNVFIYSDKEYTTPRRPKKFVDWINNSLSFFPIFSLKRCLICSDRFSNLSDISVGDAWLNQFSDDSKGTSIIIARTAKGVSIINDLSNKKHIYLNKIDLSNVIASQRIFSEYYENRLLSMKILLPNTLFQQIYKNNKLHLKSNVFWSIKIRILNLGRLVAENKYTWNYLFYYGLFFIYVWRYISISEIIFNKILMKIK
jgi:coenzyme F420 hydrogenase subunit beta